MKQRGEVQFQGDSPLRYNRGGRVTRFAVVDPEAEAPAVRRNWGTPSHVAETDYWHPEHITTHSQKGKPLARSRKFTNPSAAAPGTVSFADVTDLGTGGVYINYMNTRPDQRGLGHASRLVEHIAQQYPGHINFGKVMNPRIWTLKEKLEQQGRSVGGHRDF